MNTYETLYLMTENVQVGGNAFMDTLSVIFALVVTGYVAGPKMTRPMLWGLVGISSLFVVPMIGVVRATFDRVEALADSLPKDQFDALPYLKAFAGSSGINDYAALMIVVSMSVLYAGAIYFVFHCNKKGSVTANS